MYSEILHTSGSFVCPKLKGHTIFNELFYVPSNKSSYIANPPLHTLFIYALSIFIVAIMY